jgi:cytochrome c-type biogenesis protein CcmH/NrfG
MAVYLFAIVFFWTPPHFWALSLLMKDEYAKAIAEWQKILEIDPTNTSVQRSIDEATERQHKVEEHK